MTAEVEQRIVEMRFDNEQFEKGAKQTLSTLEKLDGILDMLGSGGGMEHLSSALSAMEYRFSRIGIIGATALQNISNKAIGLAANLLTAIPEQIVSGGTQRALNIENAKFQLKGLGAAWEDVADDIDHAVMGTAYGVDEAAKIAAILVGSGVDFKNATEGVSDMGQVLRSISGLAAMTNSSYEDIGNLMGDIFAMGKLATRQLQSFELRGLNVAAKLSEVLKNTNGDIQYTEAEIRDLISKGKIDAMTFAKAMDAAFGEHATAANETYTGSLRNMKAALSRIGADFVAPLHEGERQIMLSLRSAFDNVRKITKPFAEGRFADVIQSRAEKLSKIFAGWDFRWLERIQKFLNRSDAWVRPIDWAIKRLSDLNEITRRLFANGEGREGIGDRFEWVFKLKNWGQQQGRKIVKIFQNIRDAGRGASDIFKTLRQNAGKLAETLGKILSRRLDRFSEWTEKLKDSGKAAKAIETVRKALDKLGDAARSFARLGGSAFELLLAIFEKLLSKLGGGGRFRAFGDILGWIADKAILASDKLSNFLEKLTDIIRNDEPATGVLENIRRGFEKVGSFAEEAKDKILAFFRNLIGLKEGQTLWERFSEAVDNATGPLKSFGEAIRSTFGSDDPLGTKVTKFFAALIGGFLAYRKFLKAKWGIERLGRVFDLLMGQWDGLKTLANLPDKISTVFSRLSGSLRALTDNLNAKSLVEIAKAVILMAVGIGILSTIDTDKAVTAIEAMMISLLALMTALGFMTKFLKIGMGLGVVAPVLLALAASLLLIAAAIGVLSLVPTEKLIFSVMAMGAVLFALIMGLQQLSLIMAAANPIKMLAAAVSIGLLAAAMVVLAGAMILFSFIPAKKMLDAWLAMSAALMTVVVAVGLLSKLMNPVSMIAGAVALIGVASALILIGLAAQMFRGIDMKELLPMATALMAVVLALGLLTKFIGNPITLIAGAAALVLVGGALIVMAVGLRALSYAVNKDENALIHLAGLLAIVVIALAALSSVAPMALVAALALAVAGAALVIGAVGLLVLSAALNAFGSVKVNPDYLLALGGALVALGVAGVIFGIGGVGLGLGGAGLLVLAIALNMMAGVHVNPDYLLSLGGALMALGIAGVIFGAGGLGLLIGGAGMLSLAKGLHAMEGIGFDTLNPDYLLALGGGLAALGLAGAALMVGTLGLSTGGEALIAFSECLSPLAEGVKAFEGVNIAEIGALFGSLATAVLALAGLNFAQFSNVGALKELGEALIPLASGVKAFGDVGLWDLTKTFGGVSTALITLLGINFANVEKFSTLASNMDLLANSLGKMPSDAGDILKELATAIWNNKNDPIDAVKELLSEVNTAIEDSEPVVTEAVFTLLWAAAAAANDQRLRQNWNTIGGNIAIGIANGITGRTAEAANAMTRLAGALQRSFTVSLAIRSPSRVFEALAAYIPQGIARGIQNGSGEITTSMVNSMTGAMDVLDQYARGAQNLAPQVTPVMDMNRMRQEFSYADRMFQRSGIGSFSGFSGLTVNGDAISYNMQNRDVVGELKQMSNKINRLGQAIEQMQIVLDSGVLVGQLAPGMNRELGAMAVWEGRQ